MPVGFYGSPPLCDFSLCLPRTFSLLLDLNQRGGKSGVAVPVYLPCGTCEGQECPRGSCQNTWAQRRGVLTAAHSVTMVGGTSASPQNACPTRTWFTRRVSADVIEVKMEMSSCGMRKDPKSIENSYKRQKRRHRDTGQEEDHLRWR